MTQLTPMQMMDILLANLAEELDRRETRGNMCLEQVYPGDSIPVDFGAESCGGIAYVQLLSSVPTTTFPAPSTTVDNCTHTLAHTMTIGIWRPAEMPREVRGRIVLPSQAQVRKETELQMDDMDAIYQAVLGARSDIDMMVLGTYTPQGPNGGALGGNWSVQVGNEEP